MIYPLFRLSSLRGKATKFRSNKSKGLLSKICMKMNYDMSGTQSSYGATGRGDQFFDHEDFHKERLLPSLCSKVHFVHLEKTVSKLSIPFRLFFLTIDSAFFTHWKTLAFTLSADDQLVSLIGGAFQTFLEISLRRALSFKDGLVH